MTTVVDELHKVGIPIPLANRIMEEVFGVQNTMKWERWQKLFPFDDFEGNGVVKETLHEEEDILHSILTPEQYEIVFFFFAIGPHACQTSLSMANRQCRASMNPYFV